jgi:hypothetical protein
MSHLLLDVIFVVSNTDLVIITIFCNSRFCCCYKLFGMSAFHRMATSEQAVSGFGMLFLYHAWLICAVQSVFIMEHELVYKQLDILLCKIGIQMSV